MSLNVTQSNNNLTLHVSQSNVKATLSVTQNINELHITAIQNNEITKLQPVINTNSSDFTETDPIFQASEASLFVPGDKANLDNQSGVNTGDETTLSIQTKRPLKTVNGESLEGSGNVQINYNDLGNLPTIISNHSELNLDDGTNPHGTTKSDVGLSNVDNTSDIDKPISTATQQALDLKVDKVVGKQLSTEDYTTTEKTKLAGIQSGAEVNVNADWNATNGDAQILNKPITFTPSTHTHVVGDVTGLQTALDGKQNVLTNPITGTGTTNYLSKFTASGTIGNSQIFDNGTNVGVGEEQTAARFSIKSQGATSTDIVFRVRNSTDTRNFLVVNGAGEVYNRGFTGLETNTFFGENVARNITTGGGNSAFGNLALAGINTGFDNTAVGRQAMNLNISGSSNTAVGANSMQNNTVGSSNTAVGRQTLLTNSSGNNNTAVGREALNKNTTASGNTALGSASLAFNTTGANNVSIGLFSLSNNTTGAENTCIGASSGRFLQDGISLNSISNNSIFIGFDTRANANNQTNQIVIGHNAIGLGSNSVVLGNSSITITQLRGQVIMGSFASAPTGIEGAIYYNSTDKKHYGFNGTTWNALY